MRATARCGVRLLAALSLLGGACAGDGPDLDVHEATEATAPPADADLHDATWPEVAAWVGREADAGRPTVVNLFASWCAPCREEAPVLRHAIDRHPDVAWLGVAHLDRREDASRFLAEEALPFPTVLDLVGDVAAAVGSRGLPTTAFFDHRGRLTYLHLGVLTDAVLTEQLAGLRDAARAT